MSGHVYILASRRHGTIYIGCTTDLPKRVHEHRERLVPGFTRRYGVKRLVYVETYDDVGDAIVRERRMKEWRRAWKIALIEADNPDWQDLAVSLLGFEPLGTRESSRAEAGTDEYRGKGVALNTFAQVPPIVFMGPGLRRDDSSGSIALRIPVAGLCVLFLGC